MRAAICSLCLLIGGVCGCARNLGQGEPSVADSAQQNIAARNDGNSEADSVMAWPKDWSGHLGQTVTLEGAPENMKVGAYLAQTGQGGIWIDGLDSWPEGFYRPGKRVRVTGTVIKKGDLPVFVLKPGEPVPQGMPVKSEAEAEKKKWRYLLKDATWTLLN